MRRTAIYVRQSVERPDSVSLETQETLCRSELLPDTAVTVYRDAGYSGKNTERPALKTLMQDICADEIEAVLVYKLDRISRNLADFTQLLRIFEKHHVEFRSHSERFETASPLGQAMQSLLMVFAQLERETISGRVRDAALARAKQGFDTGGAPPAGFQRIPTTICGTHTQMLAPDSYAPLIVNGFSAYLKAEGSLSHVSRYWNDAGFRTRRGGTWLPHTVCRVLRNPVYVQANAEVYAYLSANGAALCIPEPLPPNHGVYLYADRRINHSRFTDLHGVYAICAPHLGLIAPEIWLGCQNKLTASRQLRTQGSGQKTWLSGRIFCMRCGSAMTAVRGRNTDYLICGGKKRRICDGAGAVWRVHTAEELVGELLSQQLPDLFASAAEHSQTVENPALQALILRRGALLRQLADPNGGELSLLSEAAEKLTAQIAALRAASAVSAVSANLTMPDWARCNPVQKKTIAHILLRCVIADGNTLHVFLA